MTLTDLADAQVSAAVPDSALSTPRVVVAVDHRPASAAALAWAADEALCRGMSLSLVTAFADPDQRHSPKTLEQAMHFQRRLRWQLLSSRPWIEEAELVVGRGSALKLFGEASVPGDILVVGEAPHVGAMDPTYRPVCPVVIVPAQPAPPADG
jgi:hypothetical protein